MLNITYCRSLYCFQHFCYCNVFFLFIAFVSNANHFAIAILFSFSYFQRCFSMDCQNFFSKFLRLATAEACAQDPAHSLDTPKNISVKIVPQVLICDPCGTWHGLFMVTSIHSIEKSTRKNQKFGNQLASQLVDDRRFKDQNKKKSTYQL